MFEAIRNFFRPKEDELIVMENDGGWYITTPGGAALAGPYKRPQDAKGQITRMRKGYTAGARRPAISFNNEQGA